MFRFLKKKKARTGGKGLGLKPGDEHYRAYIGPPEDYDLVAAMVFNLLTTLGMRQHHRCLDIGCGSLRVGRLLIPYLDVGNYYGVEPHQWLVRDGILNEIGQDMINIKKPTFSFRTSLEEFKEKLNLDFAVAQSIFSHCSKALIGDWIEQVSYHLKDTGALFANFWLNDKDFEGNGWIYPDCAKYTPETMSALASQCGLDFEIIDWRHPRLTWAVFAKAKFDRSLIQDRTISWNKLIERNSSEHKEKNVTWYKDVVGGMWDEIGSLQFHFLVQQGLKPEHYLLDVGCGSLRGGIHFIDYLEDRHYFGVDKNEELINAGVEFEFKKKNTRKTPILKTVDDFDFASLHQTFDFAIAQSVFTHLPWNNILRCLGNIRKVLNPSGRFFATFFENNNPSGNAYLDPITHERGGITTYMDKEPFHYDFDVFCNLAEKSGLTVEYIGDWGHPRNQMMVVFMIQ